MKPLTLKMKLAEAMKTHHIIEVVIVTALLTGMLGATAHISYIAGVAEGVRHTEQCLNRWGKMKSDGWNFYCID